MTMIFVYSLSLDSRLSRDGITNVQNPLDFMEIFIRDSISCNLECRRSQGSRFYKLKIYLAIFFIPICFLENIFQISETELREVTRNFSQYDKSVSSLFSSN